VRRIEAAEARQNAEREAARAQRMRDNAEARREIAARYDSAYRSFGTMVPEPADDEAPSAYRKRLYNRLARRLAPDHQLAQLRADDFGSQAVVFDNFEQQLLEAARREGERPSLQNLPADGSMISRVRGDDSNSKAIEWYGTESFIKGLSRPGRKVAAIIDRNTNQAIWGRPLPAAR
jgi:hypothetical protein